MSDDLVTWLRAQLDEDEVWALGANVKQGDPDWWVSPVVGTSRYTVRSKRDNRPIARVETLDGDEGELAAILDGGAVATHIARHDPARVLRDVEAKRKMLDDILQALYWIDGEHNTDHVADFLRLLALPYADREGYRPEWAAE